MRHARKCFFPFECSTVPILFDGSRYGVLLQQQAIEGVLYLQVSCSEGSSKLKLLEIKRIDLDALQRIHQHNEVDEKNIDGMSLGFAIFQNTLYLNDSQIEGSGLDELFQGRHANWLIALST